MKDKIRETLLSVFFIFGLLFYSGNCWERLYYAAPTLLPRVSPEMQTPGFWIERNFIADAYVFDETELCQFNRKIAETAGRPNFLTFPESFQGETLRKTLLGDIESFRRQSHYTTSGRITPRFYQDIVGYMSLDGLSGENKVSFGIVSGRAPQRFLPTDLPFYRTRGEVNFDLLQNNLLEIATPVAIFHTTADAGWFYVEGLWTRGWVKSEKVARAEKEEINRFINREPFVVVIRPLADIYFDAQLTRKYETAGMGVRLPVSRFYEDKVEVLLPLRLPGGDVQLTSGYLKKEDIHPGYLPYTPRTIIERAFQFLHLPYGWGGQYGFQDCSGFLQSVFATAGVFLPRDSSEQRKIGRPIGFFDPAVGELEREKLLLEQGIAGVTLLGMPGHSLLYLGQVDGRPYVIHSLYAYSQPTWHGDVVRVVNRVVVSDLRLGTGTRKGSFLERLISARVLDKQ
ncbi:MAG: SH3 domain-containing protein [Candidatus Omnitrophica bacterium]|nr:SH3 domain-containing protein [Candidatus Omnitrophota bacterium]